MLEIKAFRRDLVVRIQCEDEREFDVLVEMLKSRKDLLRMAHDESVDLIAGALILLAKAKLRVPPAGDHDVWET